MFKSKKQRSFSYIVFALYILLLIWLIMFKFTTDISELSRIRNINFIPFYYDNETCFSFHFKEVLYNILVFVPFGVYIDIFKHDWSFIKKLLPCIGFSLLCEITQYAFAIGASDITDTITNTIGGALGIALGLLLRKQLKEKNVTVINVLGLIIEIAAVTLLIILLVANM